MMCLMESGHVHFGTFSAPGGKTCHGKDSESIKEDGILYFSVRKGDRKRQITTEGISTIMTERHSMTFWILFLI
mgnify:CR=1 FL=1